MKQEYYGEIDLTKLGQIVRKHNTLVKKAQFKDGEHQILKVAVLQKDAADKFGNTASIKVACKKEEEVQGVIYWVGDLKPSTPKETPKKTNWDEPLPPLNEDNDGLPF